MCQSFYICFYPLSLFFLSFIHLFNLRLKPDAQQETRELVAEILESVKNIEGNPFKHSLEAFSL